MALSFFDARAVRVLLTALFMALVLGFVYLTHKTLIAFLFAVFFAYLLAPLVPAVTRGLHLSRGKSIGVIYLAIFGGLGLLMMLLGPRIMNEGQKLMAAGPGLTEKVSSGQIAQDIGQQRGWSWSTREQVQGFLQRHRQDIVNLERQFATNVGALAANAWWLALIPILAVFFLKDGEKIGEAITELATGPAQREFLEGLMNDLHQVLAYYIRGQIILTGIALVVYTSGYWALRVPYAFALGAISGLLEFIPLVGPLTAAVLTVSFSVALMYPHPLWLVLFLGGWRLVQDYVVAPRVMGKQVELHPLAVIFGVLAGGELGGVIGVYLSIPAMASLRVIWRRWRLYQGTRGLTQPESAAEGGEPRLPGAPAGLTGPGGERLTQAEFETAQVVRTTTTKIVKR